ncbi:RNA polymerase sigma factor [Paenibacillus phytohabitans]|uniref:RNA polymerase sigma factor n=1 Tax=Paenibacillus phytohabitans TaxID=2654978 RepID=UPI00300AA25E
MYGATKDSNTMNAAALKTLMEDYGEDVWNYAYYLARSRSAADDISQKTFIRAYKYRDTFRGEASVRTWLLRITRNRWLSYRSSSFIRRVTLQAHAGRSGSSPSAEEVFLQQSLSSEVWKVVLQLPRNAREVLMLYAHYGLSMEELAGMLGISLSAAKSRLHRARQQANEYWKKEKELNRS